MILGDNLAAQLHAEASLENCFSSHWGIDGLKAYMRYSLAGGYQTNGENVSGLDHCIKPSDGYAANHPIRVEIQGAMRGWMNSPGHRRTILDPFHKKVNVGLAWDRYNVVAVQHFEGDYVEYDRLPSIGQGRLSLSGTVKNGVEFPEDKDLSVQIYYDPPPHALTRGQVSRTYCLSIGVRVASLRPPLPPRWHYNEHSYTYPYAPCPDPYDVPASAPPARSADEAHSLWEGSLSVESDEVGSRRHSAMDYC